MAGIRVSAPALFLVIGGISLTVLVGDHVDAGGPANLSIAATQAFSIVYLADKKVRIPNGVLSGC